jgi:hypothetical protein
LEEDIKDIRAKMIARGAEEDFEEITERLSDFRGIEK